MARRLAIAVLTSAVLAGCVLPKFEKVDDEAAPEQEGPACGRSAELEPACDACVRRLDPSEPRPAASWHSA